MTVAARGLDLSSAAPSRRRRHEPVADPRGTPAPLEAEFGGLDRMDRVHTWPGIAALVPMIRRDQLEPAMPARRMAS